MRIASIIVVSLVLGSGLGAALAWWELGSAEPIKLPVRGVSTGLKPRFSLEQTVYDFGIAEPGEHLEHAFAVKNEGQAPLTLVKGETTCFCTLSNVAKGVLAPGESTEIILKWHSDKPGEFRQHANVLTNDPLHHSVMLTVQGRIAPIINLTPEIVSLGRIPNTEPKSVEIRLCGFKDEELRITKTDLSDPATADHFEIAHRPLTAAELEESVAKSGELITVTVKSGLPPGRIQQTIRLATTSARYPTVEVPWDAILINK